MECQNCEFYVDRVIDIRTPVIYGIRITKRGDVKVLCKHRQEPASYCNVTDYNEYPKGCPYRLETNKFCIISGEEHKPEMIDYNNYNNSIINRRGE